MWREIPQEGNVPSDLAPVSCCTNYRNYGVTTGEGGQYSDDGHNQNYTKDRSLNGQSAKQRVSYWAKK